MIGSSCVRTLTMKLRRRRASRTYKDFGAGCAAKYRVPVRDGQLVYEKLSKEQRAILLRNHLKKANALQLQWDKLGREEKGLLHYISRK